MFTGLLLKPKSNIMAKNLQLQIPEPCDENWNKMTPVEKGRFCDSCQKSVIDFTGMSDTQLVAFFKKPSTGSVCGRFYNDQLDRDLAVPTKRMPWLKYFFQIVVPAFLFTSKAKAQGEPRMLGDTILVNTTKSSRIINETCNVKADTNKLKKITGKLVDENGIGLPYASVNIKGTKIGVAADADGNFSIDPIDKSIATLVFSYVGFASKEMVIDANTAVGICTVGLVPLDNMIAGDVIIVGTARRKTKEPVKIFQRIFKDSSSRFFKTYPDPVSTGSLLNLEIKKAEAGEYQVDIVSQVGQIVHSVAVRFETEDHVNSLKVPLTTTGVYFVRMTSKKSGKKYVEKIVIQ